MSTPLTTRIPIKDSQGNIVGEKEVATYAGLLARAHEEGLSGIRTEVVQVPSADNGGMAIVTAQVQTHKGTFTGIGDASEKNVNRRIAPHLIRMAETRAKARALRDAVNIGVVALDELGDEVDADEARSGGNGASGNGSGHANDAARTPAPRDDGPAAAAPRTTANGSGYQNGNGSRANGSTGNGGTGSIVRMTEPQRRLLFRLVAEDGFDGEGAQNELCRRANVVSVAQITKARASELIESMKGSRGNGASHA